VNNNVINKITCDRKEQIAFRQKMRIPRQPEHLRELIQSLRITFTNIFMYKFSLAVCTYCLSCRR